MDISANLTYRKIFLFWGPLALTWLMMAFEQPFLIAFIARLGEAKYNLAAFGIAGSFAMIIEAPIIMLMSASTALVRGRHSYRKLKKFTDILNAGITVIQLIFLIPPVFRFIVIGLMEVPEDVARLAHVALLIFLPWAASIGYRRFYQGILIRHNLTRRVTYGTMVRLSVIVILGFLFFTMGVQGAYLGAAAMSLAVILEALATKMMASKTLKYLLEKEDHENGSLRLRSIARFYFPLALTSILSLGVHPFVTFFLGRSYMAVESLAVLPVVSSLVFIFRSMGLSYQEVSIALIGERKQNYVVLRNYAIYLAVIVTVLISVLAFTPLADLWFINVSGLSKELADLSYLPLKIMILLPALTVLLNFQRSTQIINGSTAPISVATAIELTGIIVVLLVCVVFLNLTGVVAASLAFMIGRIMSNLYLAPKQAAVTRLWKMG
ncbi:MAG TPA: MATE family efflux transporter [Bacteroidales bacterium]|nr:MATE family efflux transporter [Bacteroidales bacterium]HPR12539.1 MATE family efflux transporter [Bacteroidales bacterium]